MSESKHGLQIRRATNQDCESVFQLIDEVLSEWNDKACRDDSESDLLNIEQRYDANGGEFVVLESGDSLVGTHAALPLLQKPDTCTLKRLYVRKEWRGTSAGRLLMEWALNWAMDKGFLRIEFWSDSRFERAHRFFTKMGFQQGSEVREMHDSFEPYLEYYFSKELPNLDGTANHRQEH